MISRILAAGAAAAFLMAAAGPCWANGDYTGEVKGGKVKVGGGVSFSSAPYLHTGGFFWCDPLGCNLPSGTTVFRLVSDAEIELKRITVNFNGTGEPSSRLHCNLATGQSVSLNFPEDTGDPLGFYSSTVTLVVPYQQTMFCRFEGAGAAAVGSFNWIIGYTTR